MLNILYKALFNQELLFYKYMYIGCIYILNNMTIAVFKRYLYYTLEYVYFILCGNIHVPSCVDFDYVDLRLR